MIQDCYTNLHSTNQVVVCFTCPHTAATLHDCRNCSFYNPSYKVTTFEYEATSQEDPPMLINTALEKRLRKQSYREIEMRHSKKR